jgi:hypothetical protein
MKLTRINQDVIDRRCEYLESLGFTILHEDTQVEAPNGFVYDFSAINMSSGDVIKHIISKTFEKGFVAGEKNIKNNFRLLMGE